MLPTVRAMITIAIAIAIAIALALALALAPTSTHALNNGLGLTPQMGWNSWNHFHCDLYETLVHDIADALVDLGLANVGYVYVNLDDCWALERDNSSRVVPDPASFPSGMYALGEYIHGLGLKFGIYSDAGNETCAGRPGSLGYEAVDALTYAAWGVDYLKYDNCKDSFTPEVSYPPMRDALNWTGRPIFFSMCEGGLDNPQYWASPVVNSWRTTNDIQCYWDSMIGNADESNQWASTAGPGFWNDPDMLEVGNGCMSHDEEVSHFSLWALMKAPLIIGADLTSISSDSLAVLLNTEVIAVNQDPLGVQGFKLSSNNGAEVWGGPLSNGEFAAVLLNRLDNATVTVNAPFTLFNWTATQRAIVRDLWLHKNLGVYSGSFSATLAPHASVTIKLSPTFSSVAASASATAAKAVATTTVAHSWAMV